VCLHSQPEAVWCVCVCVLTRHSVQNELLSEAGREVSGQKHTGFVRIRILDVAVAYLITGTRLYRYMIRAGARVETLGACFREF